MDVTVLNVADRTYPHPAAEAWARLRPAQPAPVQIQVVRAKRKAKSIIFRLDGVTPEGSSVIAKRCRRATAAIERMIYEEVLPDVGLPCPAYYGYLDDEDTAFGWLFLGDAGGTEYSPFNVEHCRLAARWLGCLATAELRPELAARLPVRDARSYLEDAAATRARLVAQRTSPRLPAADGQVLDGVLDGFDRLLSHQPDVEAICRRGPVAVVHGDFVGKNVHVRVTQSGMSLLPFDWETAGLGVPAVDMAQFTRQAFDPGIGVYWSEVRDHWSGITWADLRELAALGRVFRLLDVIAWESWNLDYEWADASIGVLREHGRRLAQSLAALGWESARP
jgi:hypothetical protein